MSSGEGDKCKSDAGGADDLEPVLLAPYTYVCRMPGKAIRNKLAHAFNKWLKIPADKLDKISEIIQMLHNSSLIMATAMMLQFRIDDIEDNSILRRGLPVAHSIYGVPRTINAANYVYFLALEKCMQLGHPDATKVFTEQLLELHRGQGKELYWRDTVTCPTMAEYEQMVIQKTGGLFGLAVRLMQLFSTNQADFKPLWETLGLLFQIRDDLANLCSEEYAEKKSYAEDLTEGKFSFPIIYAIHNFKGPDGEIINIVRQKPTEFEVKKYCVDLLQKCGAFDFTRQQLRTIDNRILEQLGLFDENEHITAVLTQLRDMYGVIKEDPDETKV